MAASYQQSAQPYVFPSYGPPDSFFVEPPELEKARKKRNLSIMARCISDLTTATYQNEILYHMLETEQRTAPSVDSIDMQKEISWRMRPYMMDFLAEAHRALKLLPETLFLGVNIFDRYCSKRVVYKNHYQLVGCASLLIAAKYGDQKDNVPSMTELEVLCSHTYEPTMFTQMEWHVLRTIDWQLGHPTVDAYLKMILGPDRDVVVENMALYISEIALYHREFVMTPPSLMAKSSLALARSILGLPQAEPTEWASTYCHHLCVRLYHSLFDVSRVLNRKYSISQWSEVAKLVDGFVGQQLARYRHQSRLMQQEIATAMQAPSVMVSPPVCSPSTEPHTPQSAYPYDSSSMSSRCLTPPITPDGLTQPVQYSAPAAPAMVQQVPQSMQLQAKPAVSTLNHYYTPSPSPIAGHFIVDPVDMAAQYGYGTGAQ